MPSTALSTDQQAKAIVSSAHKYGIPVSVLTGVYGIETAFGTNISTSSANAQGGFQFIPPTAKTYGYPLTNTPTAGQFQQQADSAAHYLADLFRQHGGNWDAALHAYSGNGYGQKQVATSAAKGPTDLLGSIISQGVSQHTGDTSVTGGTPATQAAQQLSNTVSGPLDAISGFLTNATNWLRLGEVIAGIILVAMGLRSLTGNTTTPVSVARSAAKVAL